MWFYCDWSLSPAQQTLLFGFKTRGFSERAYFKNNKSLIATQRAFRCRFVIPCNNTAPDANSYRFRVERLEKTGSALKTVNRGRRRNVTTQPVRALVEQPLTQSARNHVVVALGFRPFSIHVLNWNSFNLGRVVAPRGQG